MRLTSAMTVKPHLFFAALAIGASCLLGAADLATARREFDSPPDAARPIVRWWWFGPAVVKPQLEQEMKLMKAGGFSGFEVQPTYPLALDGQYPGLKNVKFLSPEFFDLLGFTAAKAKEVGLRMDLTLGSGWPYGGPMFSRAEAVQSIAEAGAVQVAAGQSTVAAPPATGRGAVADAPVIAALLGPVKDAPPGSSAYVPLPLDGQSARLPAELRGATQVRFYRYAPAGLMQVKRAAYGAEGFIHDHYSPAAVEKFIREVAEPEIAACGPNVPYSIFCDSLEVAGEGWTPDFPAEFKRRRGYDLVPLLPALFDPSLPRATEIRADYGRTVAELFNDAFVDRFTRLAHAHQTRFRLQAYGTPPTTMTTYARVDLNEGENYNWRTFSGTRWASSASHLLGRTVTSAEALTWLHSPVFMAAPLDLKAETNLQFLNGINHLLFHGWPYTAPGVEYPGWRFYAAGVFNEKNPWWIVMPDINRYLARTSHLLQQGTPANDIALYLPEEDALTGATPANLHLVSAGTNGLVNRLVSSIVPTILDAGFNFDAFDAGLLALRGKVDGAQLDFGSVKYRAVVLPNVTRIAPATLRVLEAFANAGGVLVAVGAPPSMAPGYLEGEADGVVVREISARLFTAPDAKGLVVSEKELGAVLARKLVPDVALSDPQPALGFVHRHLDDAELYFFANTANQPIRTKATLRATGRGEWWNADTGRTSALPTEAGSATVAITVDLPPYGSGFVVVSDSLSASPAPQPDVASTVLDLSSDWRVTFKNAAPEPAPEARQLEKLESWTNLPDAKFFSGVGTYRKTVELPAGLIAPGTVQELDFGSGEIATVAGGRMGMRAEFQPPIGDAAVVFVNGKRAGALWCPPYRLDVTGLLQAGKNELTIEVANRAVNYMADVEHHPLPDYSALNANREFGGNRFQPQDMNQIQVTPSGLLSPVRLVSRRDK